MIKLSYTDILEHIKGIADAGRTESASFLIWYLENYYRVDRDDAINSVCDQCGDKGVDGIFINNGVGTIDIFQTKLLQNQNKTIGDRALKEFAGTLTQFGSVKSIEKIIKSGGDSELVKLIRRLNLIEIYGAYEIRGLFISNVEIDKNGESFLQHAPNIAYIGRSELERSYIPDTRVLPKNTSATLDVSGVDIAKYVVDKNTFALIAPIKAKELIKLQGISDQTLFAPNVRGRLGNTKVNQEIIGSIKENKLHKKFPLFHNGITVVVSKAQITKDAITINNFFVVNGCQSLTTLYNNQKYITDDLCILTKFVQLSDEKLKKLITEYSNNQNGVKPRDFKSNDNIQVRLQNDFHKEYGANYFYEVKRGEDNKGLEVLSNESVGILMMAFDLKEPWGTHRKYQVFDERYLKIFGRPEVNAHRILMLHLIDELIKSKLGQITNTLLAKYVLTRYTIMYILRCILEKDKTGQKLITNPKDFVNSIAARKKFAKLMGAIVDDIILELNAEMEDKDDDFDYRSKFREDIFVKELSKNIVVSHLKQVARKRQPAFEMAWGT